jgi:sigma-54 specific flagellar transcriptional regulator A
MNKKILLVASDPTIIHEVEAIVRFVEYDITTVNDTGELDQQEIDGDYLFILLHMNSSRDLQEAIAYLNQRSSNVAIYCLHLDGEDAGVLPPGIEGFIKYPIKYRNLLGTIRSAEAAFSKRDRHGGFSRTLIGVSPALREIQVLVGQVAKTDATVLLLGESGTGKEVVARSIHQQSWRTNKSFVAVNCGAIPADLLESELFGHEKGAFTGAVNSRRGRFELAEGGTLFLDEIGDMPMPMQVKLLRVLQESTFEPIGSSKSIRNTARIIAATHQDLEEKVENGSFRLDLFYRLNVFPIDIPPLRKRPEDIPLLIKEFTIRMELEKHMPVELDAEAVAAICRHPLPGNVRELENLVERMAILHPAETVSVKQLPSRYQRSSGPPAPARNEQIAPLDTQLSPDPRHALQHQGTNALPDAGVNLKQHLVGIERTLVVDALDQSRWVVAKAAKLLGLQRTTLVEKMRKLGISKNT